VLTCFTGMGELSRMTQYKDKSAKQSEAIPTGIFVYPTLMAADILLYGTHLVPVGEDQKQHLELTRDLAERVNKFVKRDVFVIPDIYQPPVGARIMSLQAPESKMSKSDADTAGAIFLSDSDDEIKKKFKRSVTDSLPAVADKELSPGVTNLLTIQAALKGQKLSDVHAAYIGRQYGYLKLETADVVIESIRPIRQKTQELLSDLPSLDAILKRGADRARERARRTLDEVYAGIGFLPRA
jgi:tryptophanyl-tRNA synthetase